MIQDGEIQRIEIENSCENHPINLDDIYKKGYSSKGKGLYNVRQILDENKYATLETRGICSDVDFKEKGSLT